MAKNILKEAIADAKAVREVALANAKAALEEAFTPKLQSMLSAKLSEDLDEDYYEGEDENMDMDEILNLEMDTDMDEMNMDIDEMDMDEKDMDEMDTDMDEDMYEEKDEEDSMDEEINLEDILNELELEEEDDSKEETLDETPVPNYKADYHVNDVTDNAAKVNQGLNEEFNLDALLEEINNLDENEEDEVNEVAEETKEEVVEETTGCGCKKENTTISNLQSQLNESTSTLNTVKSELNEVNLLNSKLLYVNRIFKANTLDDSQKLRVVETLDKAESTKEAKLIYETIKDTFNVANNKKASFKRKTKSLREGIGMASKAAGTSTAPKKEIISESNDMMTRFQKLANIKIK
jgi:hypothetical protein